jgi:hypothetical protein
VGREEQRKISLSVSYSLSTGVLGIGGKIALLSNAFISTIPEPRVGLLGLAEDTVGLAAIGVTETGRTDSEHTEVARDSDARTTSHNSGSFLNDRV